MIIDRLIDEITAPRRHSVLVAGAGFVAIIYVLLTFDFDFLAGRGAFWQYPVGPWLQDTGDIENNVDVLDYLVGYTGLVRSSWTLPLFYVPSIGAPAGTSVVFLDIIPIVAMTGRILSALVGFLIIPYGAWVGLCFILSGIFAALLVAEAGQRTLLAAIAASLFAVSAPILLHRFAHLPLMAHFLPIGAIYFYLLEQRLLSRIPRLMIWLGWLLFASLTNPYMLAMVSAIYAASLVRGWRQHGLFSRLLEPVLIGVALIVTLVAVGYLGSGSSLSGYGYGTFSMNVLSPFKPQRSGIFPGQHVLVDATGGQYEGFSYFGVGGLALLCWALSKSRGLLPVFYRHRELTLVLLALTTFAVSNHVFVGYRQILDLDVGWRIGQLAGIYRSSGRMFWPVYYAVLFGSMVYALQRSSKAWQIGALTTCCILQMIDAEPLRARLTLLTNHGGTPLIDTAAWSTRMQATRFVEIFPTFLCSDHRQQGFDLELQLTAIRIDRPFNTVYNPRLSSDCEVEGRDALKGPWATDRLYVYLNGKNELPPNWSPPNLACTEFDGGKWCFGAKDPNAQ